MIRQWQLNGNAAWKEPLLRDRAHAGAVLGQALDARTRPGRVHDYMHAKVTVADDIVFVGSFNLSHSGELNAENVLEIADPGARRPPRRRSSTTIRARYPGIDL